MKELLKKYINIKAWGTFLLANALAFVAWQNLDTSTTGIYRLFPLLGLFAFSTMWGHYMVWALRDWSGAPEVPMYSKITQYFVLLCLLLHPALFIYQLNKDGLGLPPASYEAYLGKSLVPFVFLGMVSLFAFLAYEFKKWLSGKKVWKYILIANHIAMIAILIHGFRLGSVIENTYFYFVWIAYAFSLGVVLFYLGSKKKLV